jgi:monoamine oxidase
VPVFVERAVELRVGVSAADLHNPVICRWSSHPAIGGCDIGFTPGQLTAMGPHLAAGHGLVDFAGAERSSWPNNMEGAVESGNLAAATVAHILSRPS